MNRFRLLVLGLVGLGLLVGGLWPAPALVASAQAKRLDDLMMDVNIAPLDPQAPPPLSVTTLEGVRVSLADIKKQPVLVYFWATW
jgi:cytochrome oxidase Cu insertion factor (SCO1/SenC/PrrC family)